MSITYNPFNLTLMSNVKVPTDNKPAQFETRLSKPLDLPGEWEVALSRFHYHHNWLNVKETYHCAILTELAVSESSGLYVPRQRLFRNINSKLVPPRRRRISESDILPTIPDPDLPSAQPPGTSGTGAQQSTQSAAAPTTPVLTQQPTRQDKVDGVAPISRRRDTIRRSFDLLPGNYTIEEILDCLYQNVKEVLGSTYMTIKFNNQLGKVIVTTDKTFSLACTNSPSLLEFIGFKNDSEEINVSDTDLTQ